MKTTKTTKAFLAGAAIAGLLSGSATRLQAATSVTSPNGSSISPAGVMADETTGTEKDKHGCKGQNGCKGQGGCKSGDNGCKGKNSCKGKGGCATDGSKPAETPKS